MVKDSEKYVSTGGWGFAQFNKEDAALDVNLPNYASAIVTTTEVVASISSP